jgi:hypothetical protein
VGWAHVNFPAGSCVGPSAEHPPAWEHKCVRAVVVYDGQFQVLDKRRAGDIFPHKRMMRNAHACALIQITSQAHSRRDLNQWMLKIREVRKIERVPLSGVQRWALS